MVKDNSGVMVLKKVGVMSVGRIMGILGLIGGFLTGLVWGFASMNPDTAISNPAIAVLSWWSVIVMPLAYAIGYFITGVVGAWLYNIVAGRFGGVELHLSKK